MSTTVFVILMSKIHDPFSAYWIGTSYSCLPPIPPTSVPTLQFTMHDEPNLKLQLTNILSTTVKKLLFNFAFSSSTPQGTPNTTSMSIIVAESPSWIQVFSDGSVKRLAPEVASASATPTYGFISKDVTIDSSKPIAARIFIPEDIDQHSSSHTKLPVLVYFHGGGFCIGSTTWLGYHIFLGDFSAASKCVVVSVDYRLAPENKLPTAYEDCYSSLEWLSQQVKIEPFLSRADLSRVFLSGDSAGGNITHNVALKAMQNKQLNLKGLEIKGLLLIHPYFGSENRTAKEMDESSEQDVKLNDMFWGLSVPEGSNRDYEGCNFEKAEVSDEVWKNKFPAVVVYIAELDFLNERGVIYAEFLEKKGVKEVKLVEAEKESHVFHVFHPHSEAARLLQKQMIEFISRP